MKSLNISANLTKRMAAVPLGWPPANILRQREMFVKKVAFDLHGPILDWAAAFADVAGRMYNVKIAPETARFYSMGHDVDIPLSPAQFEAVFDQFARLARGGYGDLPVTDGIQEMFKQIQDAGIKTEIWTWCPGATDHSRDTLISHGTGIAQSATYELIRKLGLVENVERQVKFMHPGTKADRMVKKGVPLIVEDNSATAAEVALNYGLACILTPHEYNKTLSGAGILRLDNHSEMAAVIIDFFKKLEGAGALLGQATT